MPGISKSSGRPPAKPKSAPRLHTSIKKETVKAQDYLRYETRFSCEDCSHFDGTQVVCTIGYNPSYHRKAEQERQFHLAGNMAFCRFLEID